MCNDGPFREGFLLFLAIWWLSMKCGSNTKIQKLNSGQRSGNMSSLRYNNFDSRYLLPKLWRLCFGMQNEWSTLIMFIKGSQWMPTTTAMFCINFMQPSERYGKKSWWKAIMFLQDNPRCYKMLITMQKLDQVDYEVADIPLILQTWLHQVFICSQNSKWTWTHFASNNAVISPFTALNRCRLVSGLRHLSPNKGGSNKDTLWKWYFSAVFINFASFTLD